MRLSYLLMAACSFCLLTIVVNPVLGTTEFGDIAVSVEVIPEGASLHGYAEYRISIANRSLQRSHQVTLALPDKGYPYGQQIRKITRSVVVGPSLTVLTSLLQPPLPLNGAGLAVVIDGQQQVESVPLTPGQHAYPHYGHSSAAYPRVWISRSIHNEGFQGYAHAALKNKAGELELVYFPADSPVTAWSAQWLGYSRYDGVIVTADDLRSMPSSVQSALWRYVECGGSLLVLGLWEVPQLWQSRREVKAGLSIYYIGFGQCVVSGEAELKRLDYSQWQYLRDTWLQTRTPWEKPRDVADANQAFPIVEKLEIPLRGILLLILLFVVVIGPLNLTLLSRKKKRIWLLWTVPAISLLTCVAVSVYAVLGEGWTGHARTEGLTLLDETSHRAATIGWTAFYTPLTPGDGLHFSYDTELTPQVLALGQSGGSPRMIDWTRDQHLATGWVTARVPAHFILRKSEMRRERLMVRGERGGSLTVVNGLGADIRDLWLADKEGTIYSAANIPAGAQAALTPAGGSLRASGDLDDLRRAFTSDWTRNVDNVTAHPERNLRPGCYIASLDASPFIEEGLSQKIKSRKCRAVVYGFMKGPGNED